MTDAEKGLFEQLKEKGVRFEIPSWETCRDWLNQNEWKINVLSDYPRGEVKLTVRHGFERLEVHGMSDLEVMAKAILEITHRKSVHQED
jgi:hypothetical protein